MAVDTNAAVRALESCGDDAAALQEALEKHKALMDSPGPARQKYRLAKSKLRRLTTESTIKRVSAADEEQEEEAKGYQFEHGASGKTYDVEADFKKYADENDASNYYQNFKWRMKQMPGGASMKHEEFYYLYGLEMQAKNGDNTAERPMWAERGGLDFEGRERWAQWERVKGLDQQKAKQYFVEVVNEFDKKKALYGL